MTELKRSRVMRMDGKLINLVHHRGHLIIGSKDCCCALTERGFALVPEDLYYADGYLAPPSLLADYVFDFYT